MIEAIVGFNGSGKGLFTMEQSFNLIAHTDICIVGNFAFNLSELAAKLARDFPEKEIYPEERIRILDSSQIKEFYKFLPLGYEVVWPDRESFSQGRRPDFSKCIRTDFSLHLDKEKFPDELDVNRLPRCVYIIDEAWEHFAYDGLTNRSKSLIWLLNQHRKFDLDVWFCSPSVTDLDPKIRNLIRKTHVMRNLGEERFWHFRKPAYFVRTTYNGLPSPTKEPEESPAFKLDLDLARCYFTEKGVGGLVGRVGADSKRKKKGLSMFWLIPVFVLFLFFLYNFGDIMTGAFFRAVDKQPAKKKSAKFLPANSVNVTNVIPRVSATVIPPTSPEIVTNVFFTGFAVVSGQITVFLSDGTKCSASSGRIGGVYSDCVVIDGKIYKRPAGS
jgi:hypothetical protein